MLYGLFENRLLNLQPLRGVDARGGLRITGQDYGKQGHR